MKTKPPNFADLLVSWQLTLAAEHKSPKTIKHYIGGAQTWLRWCENTGTTPELTKSNVQEFIAGLLAAGAQPGTARARYAALRRFSAWLAKEGEISTDVFRDMTPPALDAKITNPLSDDELKDLIGVCAGKDFRSRRDEAIIRLMAETGMRAEECVSLTVDDLDLLRGKALVRRGKGAKGRIVAFGAATAAALDRYKRTRSLHKLANTQAFWLGERSNVFGYHALYRAVVYRARLAGIDDMHPHRLRHTAATRWLAAGGSEGGLMAMAGWSSREMIDRYTAATASERAADESRRLNLGEL
jgi:site-specific recombinase XerD